MVPRIGMVHIYNEEGERVAKFSAEKRGHFSRGKGDMLSPLQVVSVQLPPGRYTMRNVRGYGLYTRGVHKGFPQGKWGFELNHTFDIEAGKIAYLGRVNGAITRKESAGGGSVARAGGSTCTRTMA